MIKEYIRAKGGIKKGIVVADRVDDDSVIIGWSLCHTPLDKFCRERAVSIASERVKRGTNKSVPRSIEKQVEQFKNRCEKYYKNTSVFIAGESTAANSKQGEENVTCSNG